MNDKGDCRTALATPGLLKSLYSEVKKFISINSMGHFLQSGRTLFAELYKENFPVGEEVYWGTGHVGPVHRPGGNRVGSVGRGGGSN